METKSKRDVDLLFDSILSLNSREECYAFFTDLMTSREITDISQRLKAAIMLDQGKSYVDVVQTTGMSSATISRVSKALDHGENGYRLVLDRMSGMPSNDK